MFWVVVGGGSLWGDFCLVGFVFPPTWIFKWLSCQFHLEKCIVTNLLRFFISRQPTKCKSSGGDNDDDDYDDHEEEEEEEEDWGSIWNRRVMLCSLYTSRIFRNYLIENLLDYSRNFFLGPFWGTSGTFFYNTQKPCRTSGFSTYWIWSWMFSMLFKVFRLIF